MAPDTDSPTPPEREERPPRLIFRRSLTRRILALNLIALALLSGSVFYLDGFRQRLIDERRGQEEQQATLIAAVLAAAPRARWDDVLDRLGGADLNPKGRARYRIYAASGAPDFDSGALRLVDPATEPWQRHAARRMDVVIDAIVGADAPEPYVDDARAWPELAALSAGNRVASRVRGAPDGTPVFSAATMIGNSGERLLTVENARDVRRLVRAERARLGLIVLAALLLSGALSLYLARTIVRPLRRLARAAVLVRQGRERQVVVPRMNARVDEIGLLARAVSDMTATLRERIDAIESFAADVSHELKNPLASLRSALDSFERVDDPALRQQLVTLMRDDVLRLDRLITDISELTRLDAQLTRTRFARVDLGEVVGRIVKDRQKRSPADAPRLAYARPLKGTACVKGDAARLGRALDNIIDNAVSFSPTGGTVRIDAFREDDDVRVAIEDAGPGVPPAQREAIFERFHSDRPEGEAFGRHSGLGLAIARTIVDGHNGRIEVGDAESGDGGARFTVSLPAAEESA